MDKDKVLKIATVALASYEFDDFLERFGYDKLMELKYDTADVPKDARLEDIMYEALYNE